VGCHDEDSLGLTVIDRELCEATMAGINACLHELERLYSKPDTALEDLGKLSDAPSLGGQLTPTVLESTPTVMEPTPTVYDLENEDEEHSPKIEEGETGLFWTPTTPEGAKTDDSIPGSPAPTEGADPGLKTGDEIRESPGTVPGEEHADVDVIPKSPTPKGVVAGLENGGVILGSPSPKEEAVAGLKTGDEIHEIPTPKIAPLGLKTAPKRSAQKPRCGSKAKVAKAKQVAKAKAKQGKATAGKLSEEALKKKLHSEPRLHFSRKNMHAFLHNM